MAAQGNEISKPNHYTWRGKECKEIIADMVNGAEGLEAVYLSNIIKYLYRYPMKGTPLKDLKKARQYLDFLITNEEMEEGDGDALGVHHQGPPDDEKEQSNQSTEWDSSVESIPGVRTIGFRAAHVPETARKAD